ncbi:MAG: hypothetical protein ACJ76P_12050 [Actinomycetota bacterium]
MTECGATDGVRGCPYVATETAVVGGHVLDVCYFHGKVARGEITEAGPRGMGTYRPLSWNPNKRKGEPQIPQPGTLEQLVQEWTG